MYKITVEDHFDAAHRLPSYQGKCSNLHGHRWVVRATWSFKETCEEETASEYGMVIDFNRLKGTLKEVLKGLDHQYLNTQIECPTAELIAKKLFECLSKHDTGRHLKGILLWESPECCIEYTEENENGASLT